jgi:putative phage-type endonuclease
MVLCIEDDINICLNDIINNNCELNLKDINDLNEIKLLTSITVKQIYNKPYTKLISKELNKIINIKTIKLNNLNDNDNKIFNLNNIFNKKEDFNLEVKNITFQYVPNNKKSSIQVTKDIKDLNLPEIKKNNSLDINFSEIKKNVQNNKIDNKFKNNINQDKNNINSNQLQKINGILNEWGIKNKGEKILYFKNQIEYLSNLPQPEQRSPEWYDFRNNILTASDLSKAIGTEGIRRSLIVKKCKPYERIQLTGKACLHGIKYEDAAIMIYEKINCVKISDFGCIQDKDLQIFGASPDGICTGGNNDLIGTMLEIKCPTSREIIEGHVPDMYWKQIQGQLEACKLWECDYFECQIIECDKEIFNNETNHKGIIINLINNESNKHEYIYSPIDLSYQDYEEWVDNKIDSILDNPNITFLNLSYWILKKMNCVKVKRDVQWFHSIIPKINNFWDDVLYYRKNGYQELENKIKKKIKKNDIPQINGCIIDSDSE